MHHHSIVRVAIGVAAAALLVSALPAQAAETYRTKAANAAHWQASQLQKNGTIYNSTYGFTDWGLTIDTAFALAADGSRPARLDRVKQAIANNVLTYMTFGSDTFANSTGKALVAAKVLRGNPRDFGGVNVRHRLLRLMAPAAAGFEYGRFRDTGSTDYSNVIGQSYGVIGLARTGGVPGPAVSYLLKQRCTGGYFLLAPTAGETCNQAGSTPDVDATALALQAMLTARAHGVNIARWRINGTTSWLVSAQRSNGSFGGGTATSRPNTNSTGLAAQALKAADRSKPALLAAGYVARLQITAKRAAGGLARTDVGAIAYNYQAFKAGLTDGITDSTRDQWRRATPQAIFALLPIPLTTLVAPR